MAQTYRTLFLCLSLLTVLACPQPNDITEPEGTPQSTSLPVLQPVASALPPTTTSQPISLEDPLPKGALRRLGNNRLWTNGYVYGLAFSKDGATVTSVNYLGLV